MLVPLKNPPMSSSWRFLGTTRGYQVWASRSGKQFARDDAGNWYQVRPGKSTPPPHTRTDQ